MAMVTRAYRKALDALEGKISEDEAKPFIEELENVSHRASTTGFYYNKSEFITFCLKYRMINNFFP